MGILHKMKENLGKERIKRGFLSFPGKIGTVAPDFPEKKTVFPVLTLLLHLSFLKIWLSQLRKRYTFEISNKRAIQ